MVFLILSEQGFIEIQQVADKVHDKLWLNKGIVSDDTIAIAQQQQWQIRIFSEVIQSDSENAIVKAIKYLEKKYPNEALEVEYL